MGKFIDLTGRRFGRLVVIKRLEVSQSNRQSIFWLCKCDCGNEKIVNKAELISSHTRSCGCLRKENSKSKTFIDITNKKFGKLTAIEIISRNKRGSIEWRCICDCGNEKIVLGQNLRNGEVKSCGCLKKSQRAYNFLDLTGKTFGKLIVVRVALPEEINGKKSNKERIHWLCQCECGNQKIIAGNSLRTGNSNSCGCIHKERSKRGRRYGEASFNKVYDSYERHAKKENRIFKLHKSEFKTLIQQNCFYCGCEPNQISKSKWNTGDFIYNGIDRLDNNIGYVLKNVVPCCGLCNTRKTNLKLKDFLQWIERVYNHSIANNQKEKGENLNKNEN